MKGGMEKGRKKSEINVGREKARVVLTVPFIQTFLQKSIHFWVSLRELESFNAEIRASSEQEAEQSSDLVAESISPASSASVVLSLTLQASNLYQ